MTSDVINCNWGWLLSPISTIIITCDNNNCIRYIVKHGCRLFMRLSNKVHSVTYSFCQHMFYVTLTQKIFVSNMMNCVFCCLGDVINIPSMWIPLIFEIYVTRESNCCLSWTYQHRFIHNDEGVLQAVRSGETMIRDGRYLGFPSTSRGYFMQAIKLNHYIQVSPIIWWATLLITMRASLGLWTNTSPVNRTRRCGKIQCTTRYIINVIEPMYTSLSQPPQLKKRTLCLDHEISILFADSEMIYCGNLTVRLITRQAICPQLSQSAYARYVRKKVVFPLGPNRCQWMLQCHQQSLIVIDIFVISRAPVSI